LPSASTFTVPSGSLSICSTLATVPVRNNSASPGSSMSGLVCATNRIWRSLSIAASSARMDFSRPTNSGITMCG